MADAASITSAAMNIYNIEAEEAAHVSDVLAAAANQSSADVADLSEGLKMAGSTAASAGYSLEETSAILAMLADHGIKGSMAGTTLRSSLMALLTPTKDQSELMEELGLNFIDANGQMVDAATMAGMLSESFEGMDDASRAAAAGVLFGTYGLNFANALMAEGEEGMRGYSDAMGNVEGEAKGMADAIMSGPAGAMEKMSGAVETAQMKLGQALAPAVIKVAEAVGKLADWFSNLSPEMQKNIAMVGAVVSAIGPLLVIVGTLTVALSGLATASLPIAAVVLAVVALTAAFATLAVTSIMAEDASNDLTVESKRQADEVARLEEEHTRLAEAYGEDSVQALEALHAVNEATTAFEANKQTVGQLRDEITETTNSYNDMITSLEEHEGAAQSEAGAMLYLIDRYEDLIEKETRTEEEERELAAITQQLADSDIPGMKEAWDEATHTFTISAEAMRGLVSAQLEQAKATAISNMLTSAYEKQWEAERELATATEQQKSAQDDYNAAMKRYNEVMDQGLGYTTAMTESGLAGYEKALTNANIALEDATTNNENLGTTVKDLEQDYGSLTISMQQWENDTAALLEKAGGDFGTFVGTVTSNKEEYAGMLSKMGNITAEELAAITAIYDTEGVSAQEAYVRGIAQMHPNVMAAIETVGPDMIAGLADGISEDEAATLAAEGVSDDVIQTLKDTFGISSPSTVAKGIANNVVLGLSNGLDEGGPATSSAESLASGVTEKFKSGFDIAKTTALGIFGEIKSGIGEKMDGANTAVGTMIDSMKKKFDFTWSLPSLKVPKIGITGSFSLNPPSFPHFDLSWHAQGGIFNKPSVIGVGEAGSEAVLPLSAQGLRPFAEALQGTTGAGNSYTINGLNYLPDSRMAQLIEEVFKEANRLKRMW
jgi:TP901 family phage tail tape measure protein